MARREGELRARDVDRMWTMARLDEAFTDGQLTADDHDNRLAHARAATLVPELDRLLSDLQLTLPLGDLPQRRARRRRLASAGAALLLAVAVIATLALVWNDGAERSEYAALKADQHAAFVRTIGGSMYSRAALDELIRQVRTKFGTTAIAGANIFTDRAEVYVDDATSPAGHYRWAYTPGGRFHEPQAYGGTGVAVTHGVTVDLARIDTGRLVDLIESTPGLIGVTDMVRVAERASFRVSIEAVDGGEVWVGVNNMAYDSHLVADLDLAIKGLYPCQSCLR